MSKAKKQAAVTKERIREAKKDSSEISSADSNDSAEQDAGANTTAPSTKKRSLYQMVVHIGNPLITAAAWLVLLVLAVSLGKGAILPSQAPESQTVVDATETAGGTAVVDVVNMTLPDAERALKAAGFTNVITGVDADADKSQWMVIGQSVAAGESILPGDELVLTCAKQCKLYLDIRSEQNLMFSTYDIAVTLDGKEIGTIANGEEFTYLAEVLSGNHRLEFCKSGSTSPKAMREFYVSDDLTFTCDLSHDRKSIDIENQQTEISVAKSELEVIDVTGMVLSEATDGLNDVGFTNVRGEPYADIWNSDNWIVTGQRVAAGTIAPSGALIQLDCMSLDDYFSTNYVGKNVNETQKLAEADGFTLRFEDASYTTMDSMIADMNESEKNDWVVTKAGQYAGAKKTAVVTVEYTGETPGDQEPEPSKYEYACVRRLSNYDMYFLVDFDEMTATSFTTDDSPMVLPCSGDMENGLTIDYVNDGFQETLRYETPGDDSRVVLTDANGFDWDYTKVDVAEAEAVLAEVS